MFSGLELCSVSALLAESATIFGRQGWSEPEGREDRDGGGEGRVEVLESACCSMRLAAWIPSSTGICGGGREWDSGVWVNSRARGRERGGSERLPRWTLAARAQGMTACVFGRVCSVWVHLSICMYVRANVCIRASVRDKLGRTMYSREQRHACSREEGETFEPGPMPRNVHTHVCP